MTESTARELVAALREIREALVVGSEAQCKRLYEIEQAINAFGVVVQNYTEDNALYADVGLPEMKG